MSKTPKSIREFKKDLERVQAYKNREFFRYRGLEPPDIYLGDLTVKLAEEGILKEIVEETERKK